MYCILIGVVHESNSGITFQVFHNNIENINYI